MNKKKIILTTLGVFILLGGSYFAYDYISQPKLEINQNLLGKNLASSDVKIDASSIKNLQTVREPKDILAILTQKAPQLAGLKPDIKWNPQVNLYELHAGLQVVYVTKDGKNLIQGHIYSIDNGTDYTDLSVAQLTKIDTNTLPMNYSIKIKNGDGTNPLYVFSPLDDNLKTYYQNTLSQLNNVTMYFFLTPSPETVNDDGYAKEYKDRVFKWVYCSDDQPRELSNFLTNKTKTYAPVTSQIDKCLEIQEDLKKQALFEKYKIMYAPTLFTGDGNRYQPQNLQTLKGLLIVSQNNIESAGKNTESNIVKKTASQPK